MESGRVFRHRFTCIALLTMLFWSCGRSQKPGFLSIDCGSDRASIYTDRNGIEWVSDSNLINVGTSRPVTGGDDPLLATIRLFEGNQSKYCYSLSNSAVVTGAFFLVRASIWAGITPPYAPKNADGHIRFKMIVDANKWYDVKVPYGSTTWWTYDMYTRAQRSSIDVCFGRSTPDGDAPFISALELRPLPSTLTAAYLMNGTNTNFVCIGHNDYGVPSSGDHYTRYPYDIVDRIWIAQKASEATDEVNITTLAIDVTKQLVDELPSTILQNSLMGAPYITLSYSDMNLGSVYVAEFYFAEIDPAVNASGMRTFSIYANGDPVTTSSAKTIDVFAAVGANTGYYYLALASPNSTGDITFNFTPTATSVFPPFLAAAELFEVQKVTNLTAASIVNAVEDIKVHLGLSSYTGDPCLPSGYGYPWLDCSGDVEITTILLSNYGTSGEIPGAINLLPTLIEVYLDGNNLHGEIPDLSALVNLEALHLNNNRLSGSIPDFLATLKNLKVLYLQNNNLSGEIPAALLQRKQASQLKFEFSGNLLCESNNAECGPSPSSLIGPSTLSKKSSIGAIIGGAVAGILLVVIVIGSAAHYCCLRRPKEPQGFPQDSPVQNKVIPKVSVQEFSFQEINNATNNFHTPLGQGGFGSVYKGCLQDGRFVAIKVASNFSHQGPREFLNEVDLLSRVHHKNLVALLGFCNAERLVLVYEFMPNGSLDDCLHGPYSRVSPLPWRTRLRILVDAAQGIDYLHNGCNPPIIHRDVKSSNILLNDKMEAKISDFGISRDYIRNETGALPTVVMGSRGYMDPEYVSSMNLTQKVDIYSFGVLLFEVVCGRKAILEDPSHQQMNIVEWAKDLIDNGVIDDIVDVSLHGQYNPLSVRKVVDVGLACVEIPSSKRPKIGEIYLELTEAERMELGSDERNTIDQTPVDLTIDANSDISCDTEVSAR